MERADLGGGEEDIEGWLRLTPFRVGLEQLPLFPAAGLQLMGPRQRLWGRWRAWQGLTLGVAWGSETGEPLSLMAIDGRQP